MKKFPLALLAAAAALAVTPSAMATSVDINFACSGHVSGANATGLYATSPATNLCTTTAIGGDSAQDKYGPGHNLPSSSPVLGSLAKWTQATGDFTITASSSVGWNQNQGEANNANTAGVVGDTALDGGTGVGSGFTKTGTITVTDGGLGFYFDSVDLKTIVNDFSYSIKGYVGNTLEFTIACGNEATGSTKCAAFNSNLNVYQTIDGNLIPINKLVISLTDNGSVWYLDNIDLTTGAPLPEPDSLLLLGTGLLGLGALIRRRTVAKL